MPMKDFLAEMVEFSTISFTFPLYLHLIQYSYNKSMQQLLERLIL